MGEYLPRRPLFLWALGFLVFLTAVVLFPWGGRMVLGTVVISFIALLVPQVRRIAFLLGTGAIAAAAVLTLWEMRGEEVFQLEGREAFFQGVVIRAEKLDGAARYELYGCCPQEGSRAFSLPVLSFRNAELEPGEEVEGVLSFSKPGERGKQAQGYAQGFLLEGEGELCPSQNGWAGSWKGRFARLASAMARSLERELSPKAAGLARAVLLSDDSGLDPRLFGDMRRCGTAHLLVVSGYHVSLLLGGLMLLLRKLRSRPWMSMPICAGVLAAFAGLVGFTPSVVRASVMGMFCLLAQALGRENDSLTALAFSAVLLLVQNPYCLLSWGFLLSFASTLSIVLFAKPVLGWMSARAEAARRPVPKAVKAVWSVVGISAASAVLSFPMLAVMSGWLPMFSPLANLLVAPFLPLLFFAAAGTVLLGLAGHSAPGWLVSIADLFAWMIDGSSRMMARIPFVSVPVNDWWAAVWLAGAAGVLLVGRAFFRSRRQAKWLVLLAVPLLIGLSVEGILERNAVAIWTQPGQGSVLLSRGSKGAILLDGIDSEYDLRELALLAGRSGAGEVELLLCPENISAPFAAGACRLLEPRAVLLPGERIGRDGLRLGEKVWQGALEGCQARMLGGVTCPARQGEGYVLLEIGDAKVLKLLSGYDIIKDKSLLRQVNLIITPGGEMVPLDPALSPSTLVNGQQRVRVRLR